MATKLLKRNGKKSEIINRPGHILAETPDESLYEFPRKPGN